MSATNMKVLSVNISKAKGTKKEPVEKITVTNRGITDDAHYGSINREISLLGMESIKKFSLLKENTFLPGDFAENITTEGLNFNEINLLDRLIVGETELEITQIGKKCHGNECAIFSRTGDCIMPKEGLFARIIEGGVVKPGDTITYCPKTYKLMIITLSDRASTGEYENKSGSRLKQLISFFLGNRHLEFDSVLTADDKKSLADILLGCREKDYDFIFTTGGTGIGERDITPDVVSGFLDIQIPGIMDSIRLKYGADNPNALISRSVAGVMNKSLIFTLPGSVRAVEEYMAEINKVLMHLLFMLHNLDTH